MISATNGHFYINHPNWCHIVVVEFFTWISFLTLMWTWKLLNITNNFYFLIFRWVSLWEVFLCDNGHIGWASTFQFHWPSEIWRNGNLIATSSNSFSAVPVCDPDLHWWDLLITNLIRTHYSRHTSQIEKKKESEIELYILFFVPTDYQVLSLLFFFLSPLFPFYSLGKKTNLLIAQNYKLSSSSSMYPNFSLQRYNLLNPEDLVFL